MRFFGNDMENAVIKELENGTRLIKTFTDGVLEGEFQALPDNKHAFEKNGAILWDISEKEYNSFGINWRYF